MAGRGAAPTGDLLDAQLIRCRVQERAKASSQGRGKLGKQLDAERGRSQADTLAQNARDNVAARDADAATEARNYN